MKITEITSYKSAIYSTIYKNTETIENEKVYDEENDIIQIEVYENIMEKRLMRIQIEIIKKFFLNDLNNIKDFNDISDERKIDIINIANFLRDTYNKDKIGEDYFYKLLLRVYSSNLGLLNRKEKVILIIEICDPNFEQYKKYSDIYNIYSKSINKKITDEDEKIIIEIIRDIYGDMTSKLVSIEKLYIQKFEIDKAFSNKKLVQK